MNVSVVLPSFNRARLLPITIPTYFQEDVSEVILVDDCSSDNTAEVVKELQTRFPTLRYFRNEVNSKQPYTQNVAISKVQSEYIYFGDDDSVLYPGSIRNLLNVMREKMPILWEEEHWRFSFLNKSMNWMSFVTLSQSNRY